MTTTTGSTTSQRAEPIAITGMALAIPGATSTDELDQLLWLGSDVVSPIPASRFELLAVPYTPDHLPAALLPRIEHFDHTFFGISPREARAMDPHQRLMLQLVWQAVEDAGHGPGAWRGRPVGVFLTSHGTGYQRLLGEADTVSMLGTAPAAIAGRVSYLFGFEGPSLVVDTGCSSGLVCVQLACAALDRGECDVAMAGGISLKTSLTSNLAGGNFRELLATSGKCRAFDARADGTSDGEGGVLLVLRRLSDALADEDPVRAVIKSVIVTHNGSRSNGFSTPSPVAQTDLLRTSWRRAGATAANMFFVEAHGSGTRLGDAIELNALQDAWSSLPGHDTTGCRVSSIKSNLGHLDHVAGLAGLAKAVLSLQTGRLYPSLHFSAPNTAVRWDGSVQVVTEPSAAPVTPDTVAGVSSFSLTGANAHIVIGSGHFADHRETARPNGHWEIVTLAAKSVPALRRYAATLRAFLLKRPELDWRDVVYTMNAGRDDLARRIAFPARDRGSVLAGLYEAGLRDCGEAGDQSPVVTVTFGARTFSDGLHMDLAHLAGYQDGLAGLVITDGPIGDLVRGGAQQVAVYLLLSSLGIRVRAAADDSFGEVLKRLAGEPAQAAAVARLLATATRTGHVSSAPGKPLIELAAHQGTGLADGAGSAAADQTFPSLLARAYELGADLNWASYYAGRRRRRLALPGYSFDQVSCWPDLTGRDPIWPSGKPAVVAATAAPAAASADEPIAQQMAEIWSQVLGVDELDAHSNYFALGGNSVLALELVRMVETSFGTRLRLVDLYESPTLGALSRVAERAAGADSGTAATRITPADSPARSYVPSFGQESLWILHHVWPDANMYNLPVDVALAGDLDPDALRLAFRDLARRHDVLRARMISRNGSPVVFVGEDHEPDFLLEDLSAAGGVADRWEQAWARAADAARQPFDLERDNPLRVRLYRVDPRGHLLLIVTHHSADDGWTPALFARDLRALYIAHREGTPPDLPELPIRYSDYAGWQRRYWTGKRLAEELEFWRKRLDGVTSSNVPTDKPRPAQQSGLGDHCRFTIGPELTAAARRLGKDRDLSLFVILISAFKATLARWSQEDDITVGITTAGRDQPEVRDLIGYFNNAVALRTDLSGNPTFAALLARERAVITEALDHDAVPFAEVVATTQTTRDPSRHPVFQVGMTHQHLPPTTPDYLPGVTYDRSRPQRLGGVPAGTAKWDLDLGVWDRDNAAELPAIFEYSTDLWERDTIEQLVASFLRVLEQVVADPERRLSAVELASPAQVQAELAAASGRRIPVLDEHWPLAIFRRAARRDPSALWVTHQEWSLTYGEADALSDRIAAQLDGAGLRYGQRVATFMANATLLVASILAVWKAGLTWVPIDTGLPASRLRFLASDAQVAAVVVDEAIGGADPGFVVDSHLPELGIPVIDVRDAVPGPARHLALPADAEAYVLYTSGSTGTPKGVAVRMSSLAQYCAHWRSELPAGAAVLTMANPMFDVFVGDMLRALSCGGRLVVGQPQHSASADALREILDGGQVTVAEIAPFAVRRDLVHLLRARGAISGLDVLIAGSEGWQFAELAATRQVLKPAAKVITVYGLTECTIDSTAYVDDGAVGERGTVPIGSALPNNMVVLLEPGGYTPVPRGALGEICVGGPWVGVGYSGRPGLTADRFVPDPFSPLPGGRLYRTGDVARRGADGLIRFHGRLDRQVKVNGVRVEPAEVEATLRREPGVRDTVVARVDHPERKAVLGALVEVGAAPATDIAARLRRRLADELPLHHVPSLITTVDLLPRLPNNKPDMVAALALMRCSQPDEATGKPPESALELELLSHWEKVLDCPVSIDTNFFEAGGTSLLAIRLVTELSAAIGIQIPAIALFRAPSPAELASLLVAGDHQHHGHRLVRLRPGTATATTLFLAHASGGEVLSYYNFARALPGDLRVYGLRVADPDPRPASIEELAADYLADIDRVTVPGDRLHVAGWSFGGLLAFEIARRWMASGRSLGFLGLIDADASITPESVPDDEAELLATMLALNEGFVLDRAAFDAVDPAERFAWVATQARQRGSVSRHMADADLLRLVRINVRNDQAMAAYRPRRLAAAGTVFRCGDESRPRPADLGWRALLGHVTVVPVTGTHYRLFADHAEALAHTFGAEIARAQNPAERTESANC